MQIHKDRALREGSFSKHQALVWEGSASSKPLPPIPNQVPSVYAAQAMQKGLCRIHTVYKEEWFLGLFTGEVNNCVIRTRNMGHRA